MENCWRLLKIREINPNSALSHTLSEISFPLSSSQELVIRLLLKHENFDINLKTSGMAPIHHVARFEKTISESEERIIKLIINHPGLDPNLRCGDNHQYDQRRCMTPLMIAAEEGHLKVVKELLKQRDTNLEAMIWGYRPWPMNAFLFAVEEELSTHDDFCKNFKENKGPLCCFNERYVKIIDLLRNHRWNREEALKKLLKEDN